MITSAGRTDEPNLMRIMAVGCGAFAVLGGVSAIAGWWLDAPWLTDWANQGISMFPNAALCGIFLGSALVLLALAPRARRALGPQVCGGAALLLATITLIQHATGADFGIDRLLAEKPWGQAAAAAPMRMGPPASSSYMLLGAGLILVGFGGRARTVAPALAMAAAAVALLSLTGYVFGADQLFGIARYSGIALQTSVVIAALSVGLMAAVPEHGLAAALTKQDAGGAMLRRLIVPIIVVPLLLGWIRLRGQDAGLYDVAFGTALRTLAEIFLFVALLWWTARNISKHEDSAVDAQSRIAAIVESSDDAIVSKSLEGVIQSWNPGAQRIFGYTPEEAVGRPITIIIPPDRLDEEKSILDRLRRGIRIEHFETVRVRKDGRRIGISLTVSPVKDAAGRIIGASKIARDISDRRRYEERLRAVVEATPECVKIVSADGMLEFMNQAGLCMVEGDSEPAVVGKCVFDLIAPEHRQDWMERHRRICAGEKLTWEFEIVGLKGARRWMETHAVPLAMPDGSTGQLAVTREITARKQFEQEREVLLESERAARREAERANHLKDEFLATLSHELRTPLNAILGWSQILGLSSGREELDQGLDAIQRNARAQAQLIEDLLDMSRIISGKIRLDVHPTDLAPVVQAAIESVMPAIDAKEIVLRKVFDPHLGVVSGDSTRLQQIAWNLFTNAVKFTPKGGKIDVVLHRAGSQVELIVRDTGIGIPAESLPVIFERFRQVDSSSTRSHGGLGLGLSIVKHLVELHGGSIRAESEGPGKGSTFVVSFPLSPIRGGGPSPDRAGQADWSAPQLEGVKILVVDDEPDARALVERVLARCGADVRAVESATRGLEELRAFQPHVLVSDIGMPTTDGYQFIREVRSLSEAEGGRTPAIALTAFARSEDRMRAMLAGFQVHVAKPIEPQELAVTVRTLHRGTEANDAR